MFEESKNGTKIFVAAAKEIQEKQAAAKLHHLILLVKMQMNAPAKGAITKMIEGMFRDKLDTSFLNL